MTRSIFLFTLMIATVASANAQNLEFMGFNVRDEQNVWTYSVICPQMDNSLVVELKIPRSAYVKQAPRTTEYSLEKRIVTSTEKDSLTERIVISTEKDSLTEKKSVTPKIEYSLRQKRLKDGTLQLQIKFLPTDNADKKFNFEVIAPKNATKNGEIAWTIEASPKNIEGMAPGPVASNDPIIRPVLGVGGSWRFRGKDFKVENDAVLIKYDGYFQPSLNTGFLLNCFNSLDLLLSLEFGVDSSKIIDGFVGGFTFRIPRFPEIFLGVSMRTEQKLRSGFEEAAKELVADIDEKVLEKRSVENTSRDSINYYKAIKWNFDRFKELNEPEDYDGFPTFDPRDGSPIFYGTPLIDHTNWAFVCGIALPIDIGNWIPNLIGKIVG